jgi:hypothetical protein
MQGLRHPNQLTLQKSRHLIISGAIDYYDYRPTTFNSCVNQLRLK